MLNLITFIVSLFVTDGDARALQRTAPELITIAAARDNYASAQIASVVYDVDTTLVLAIAMHESHLQPNAIGPESGHRVSCGPMTPMPVASCVDESMLAGYLAGAKHLRGWIDAMHGDERAALIGYAGGYRLIAACSHGQVIIRPGVDACLTPEVFRWRAAWIRREIARPDA